ncbi:MAG: phage head closure protein [Alphaproteobacteria bacterium]|nr:phage head closure protein [Alphaproteobacteria bacterium]
MGAGKCNQEIIIQKRNADARDAAGQLLDEWKDFKKVKAYASPKGSRQVSDSGEYDEESYVFTVRYAPNVTHDMRVLYQGYAIKIHPEVLPHIILLNIINALSSATSTKTPNYWRLSDEH